MRSLPHFTTKCRQGGGRVEFFGRAPVASEHEGPSLVFNGMRINELVADVRARLRAGRDSCFLADEEIRTILEECMTTVPRGRSRAALVDCAVAKVADFCAGLPHEGWRSEGIAPAKRKR